MFGKSYNWKTIILVCTQVLWYLSKDCKCCSSVCVQFCFIVLLRDIANEPPLCCLGSKILAGCRRWYGCHIFTQQRNEHLMASNCVFLFNPALSLCQCGTMASLRRGSWWVVGRKTGSRHLQLGKKTTLFLSDYNCNWCQFPKQNCHFSCAHDRCLEPKGGQTVAFILKCC